MYDSELTNYLTGAAMMASNIAHTPSYVTIDAYKKDENITTSFTKCESSLKEILKTWFNGKDDVIDGFLYLTKTKVGEPINIYELSDDEFNKIENESIYYMLEEAYVVEYKNYLLYFKIGNNE